MFSLDLLRITGFDQSARVKDLSGFNRAAAHSIKIKRFFIKIAAFSGDFDEKTFDFDRAAKIGRPCAHHKKTMTLFSNLSNPNLPITEQQIFYWAAALLNLERSFTQKLWFLSTIFQKY